MNLGPALEDIIIHASGSNFTTWFRYRITLQYRFGQGPWLDDATPVVLLGATPIAVPDYQVSLPYTNRQKFGREIRLLLETQIQTGQTGTQRGTLSISAGLRLVN